MPTIRRPKPLRRALMGHSLPLWHVQRARRLVEQARLATSTAAAVGSTLNESDKAAGITLSNGNLTATATGGTGSSRLLVRATTSKSSGKWVFAFDPTAVGAATGEYAVGVAAAGASLTNYLGNDNNSIGAFANGQIWRGGVQRLAANAVTDYSAAASEVMIAVDLDNHTFWVREGAGNWNNNGSADPATNTGGIDISALPTTLFPTVQFWTANDAGTINFGAIAFTNAAPSGFTAWG